MKKRYLAVSIIVLAVLTVGFLAFSLSGLTPFNDSSPTSRPIQTTEPTSSPTTSPTSQPIISSVIYTYEIITVYPHDTNAFTQGLTFGNGILYESTGQLSSLRRVDLESGVVEQEVILPAEFFGEGLTVVNNSLIQLTWQNHIGFIYDKVTFDLMGNFTYSTEGWGLTYNGSKLIMSDGTSNLYFLDPTTFQKTGQVSVHDGNTSITNINELEYVNGDVYANIWLQQKIAIINPQNGQVKGWIDLSGIYQSNDPNAVLNGIAYDSQTDRLYVTGKDWPKLYQITITPTK
jgi:glutaminyl-peptide cyclotransferase